MRVTPSTKPAYEMRKGYDSLLDLECLLRSYDDGTSTVAFRSGRGQTHQSWGPEVELHKLEVA